MASTDPEHREEEGNAPADDEDTGAQIAPIVKLEEVAVTTGEEDEDAILDLKAKLYRFDKEGNQWKERGTGNVKFLKHKETGKVRLVMRQSKTLKICANHLIIAGMTVQEHAGNEKSCVWHATDFADEELKDEMFCIRFASVETHSVARDGSSTFLFHYGGYDGCFICVMLLSLYALSMDCKAFMETFQEVAELQMKQEENKDASATAEALEKLSVEEKKGKAADEATETQTEPKNEDENKDDEKKAEHSSV